MKDASPQPRETLWVAKEGTQARSSLRVWVGDADGQGRRTARERCSKVFSSFRKSQMNSRLFGFLSADFECQFYLLGLCLLLFCFFCLLFFGFLSILSQN